MNSISIRCARLAAFAVGGISILALLGWFTGIDRLRSWSPELVAMNPVTALTFLLSAAALWLVIGDHPVGETDTEETASGRRRRPSGAPPALSAEALRWKRVWAAGGATLTGGIGGLKFIDYLTGSNLSFDRYLFHAELGSNQMAPNTAVCFAFTGLALLLLDRRVRWGWYPSEMASLGVLIASVMALLGYFYGSAPLYGVSTYFPMAANTAVSFAVLALGALAARPEHGLMSLVTSRDAGSVMLRRLLPAAILIPCLLGWLRLQGVRLGWFAPDFGLLLFVTLTMTGLLAVLLWTTDVLNRTGRARSEALHRIRTSEERVRDLYDSAPCGYHSLDEEGRYVEINRTELDWLGYEKEDVLGRRFDEFLTPSSQGMFTLMFPELKETGSVREVSVEMVHRDGSTIPVLITATAVTDRAGRFRYTRSTVFDISARREAEKRIQELNASLERRVRERTAELAAANRELRERNEENELFVYSVSHDLRSPLVNLQGFSQEIRLAGEELQTLLKDERIPADVRDTARDVLEGDIAESIRFIRTAVTRLSGMIDALLRLSRAGRVEYEPREVDVRAIVVRTVESYSAEIAERGAQVAVQELAPAWGDRLAIEQVFANLINNALHYLDPDRPGQIAVGMFREERLPSQDGLPKRISRVYYVSDNGLGISESHRHKVFGAFQRLHPRRAPGEGMGLALVKRIVERHDGEIWFESTEGVGTTFFVRLPVPESRSTSNESDAAGGAHHGRQLSAGSAGRR